MEIGALFPQLLTNFLLQMKLVVIEAPNGWRYPLVGGTRQRHFDGTNFKPRKVPENAQTPTTIVLVLYQGSGARIVSPLVNGCAIIIFFSFFGCREITF